MISHTHATDTQTKSTDLASKILAATTPQQIAAVCGAIESFLHKHTPDQTRWFFSITFPTLICKIFGFAESPPHRPPQSPTAWVDSVDSELASRVFNLLSPIGVLITCFRSSDCLSGLGFCFRASEIAGFWPISVPCLKVGSRKIQLRVRFKFN
ncbi:hypothetical protein CsSME_00044693 [Camellia sinensis var. sinensis]